MAQNRDIGVLIACSDGYKNLCMDDQSGVCDPHLAWGSWAVKPGNYRLVPAIKQLTTFHPVQSIYHSFNTLEYSITGS